MDGPATVAARSSSRTALSCMRCSSRKVRCDRQKPACSACLKHGVDCVYVPQRPPRQKPSRRVKDLTNLVKHYETLLDQRQDRAHRTHPVLANTSPRQSSMQTSRAPDGSATLLSTPQQPLGQLQLRTADTSSMSAAESDATSPAMPQRVITAQILSKGGRSKFIENDLWDRVVEELESPEDALGESSDEESSADEGDQYAAAGTHTYVLYDRNRQIRRPRHPGAHHIRQLVNVFATNVDPLIKVLHMPSLRIAMEKAVAHVETIPRGFEALMFSLYAAAIMSSSADECQEMFGESRKHLLKRYVAATKQALVRANFMSTISLVVLQALVLHIITIRDTDELRAVWTLTGVAVRIAQGMGLNQSSNTQTLSPFESEMRRRLWWILHSHDWRCAELCGMSKFRDLEPGFTRPAWPLNVNDDDISPGFTVVEEQTNRMTDVAFLNIRCELIKFASKQIARLRGEGVGTARLHLVGMAKNQQDIEKDRDELEEIFETQFIRYCDPSQPLHLMVMTFARHAITVTTFLMNHPRRWASLDHAPPQERRYVWDLSIKLLEQHCVVLCNPLLQRFAWHAPFFLQWHGLIHTLDALRADPLVARADMAWRLIAQVYQYTPDLAQDMRKPINVAVGNLCLKAYRARELAVQHGLIDAPVQLKFIVPLADQLQTVRNRANARRVKDQQAAYGSTDGHTVHAPTALNQSMYTPRDPPSGGLGNEPSNNDDGFWLAHDFGDSTATNITPDEMNIDLESLATDSAAINIDWALWDTWLTNSNLMGPPLSSPSVSSGT